PAGSLSFGWAGLGNYAAILGDPIFLRALRNSAVVTVGTQLLVVILATAAAQVFRATFRGKRFARFVLLLPWAVPVSLAAIAWTWIFDSTFSVINWTLKASGLLHGWLYWIGDPGLALTAIIIPVLPTFACQRGILGADLGQGAAIAVFLLPFLIVVAVAMLRLARRAEVGGAAR